MTTPTPLSPEQHAKLPRWASDHIGRVEAVMASAVGQLEAGPDDSNAVAVNYLADTETPLGKPSHIEFTLGDGNRVSVRVAGPHLYVTTRDGGLTIRPHVSNVVLIGTEER